MGHIERCYFVSCFFYSTLWAIRMLLCVSNTLLFTALYQSIVWVHHSVFIVQLPEVWVCVGLGFCTIPDLCPSNIGTVPQVLLQMRSPLSFADCWEGWGSYAPASLVLWGFGLLWLFPAETTDSACKWEEFTAHGGGVRLMEDTEEEEARINSFLFQSPIHMRCHSDMDSQKTSWEIKAPTILAAIETSSIVVPL